MPHQIAHQDVNDVVIEARHRYTDNYYSKYWLIASSNSSSYAPPEMEERFMLRGIKFVSIPVRNQDVALKFYTEALGMKVVTDQPFTETQRWIELGINGSNTGVALFTPEGHEKRIGEFHGIAFWCDDVFATAKTLKAKGVQFAQEPKTESWGSVAVFKDPDGNQFALSSKTKQK